MNHLNKKVALLIAIVFSLCCIQLASAAIYYTPTYANISENFMLNITISAPADTGNITEVRVNSYALPPFAINATSNATEAPGGYFAQIGSNLKWWNASGTGLVNATTNQSFTIWLNNTIAGAPSSFRHEVCIYNSTNTSNTRLCTTDDPNFVEVTNITIGMNFGFSGTAKLENGSFQPNTNVTIYDYVTSAGGPPSEIPIASALTNSNGLFRLWGINGSKSLYKLKMSWANSTRVHYVGSNLPPFPGNMFYPMPPPPGSENMPMFKKMPNINGSTFYMQSAATINISARGNTTPNAIDVKFGYEVVDQAVGFPIESNVRTGVWSKEVVVPIGRSYTVIAMRDPVTFPTSNDDGEFDECTSDVGSMNASVCPAPPTSNEVLSASLVQGGIVQTVMNLSYTMQYLSGCINLSGNTSKINIINVITRMTPWAGFVPPIDAKISAFNITNSSLGYDGNIVYNDQEKCAGYDAFYNMSLMGSSNGIGYLIEFYGKNASNEAGNPGNAVNLAAFQNLTMNESSKFINITLKPLAGAYATSATLNTSKIKIFVHNSSGSASENAITTSMHVEVKVKHPIFGTMHYIIEDISGGITYLPILANSTWAKVSIYPNEAPPVEKTLNLLATQNNVTVQVSEMTFRRPLSNGSLQSINTSTGSDGTDSASNITMTFYRNDASTTNACNTPNPPSSCLLTQMNANDFNPMLVMMAGKVNLELKMTSNTTLYFINFDLMSAKPPTNSIMSNNASSASANAQTWEAGSFVPHVYDHAFVVMPYSETSSASNYINESLASFNMSLPYLRDENWNVVFNTTNGSSLSSLPDDYSDFNSGIYAPLLRVGGTTCNLTNTTDVCYMDKGNNTFSLKVPHFSGLGSAISGLVPAVVTTTAAAATADTTSSSGGTAASTVTESRTFASVTADSENTYRLSDADTIGVNAVLFTATESLESVRVTVSKLSSKPSSVSPDPEGEVYRYIEVDAPKLEGKTKEAKIQFEVTKAWLDSNDFAAEDVILMRFANNKWNALTTSKLSESSSKAYYEALSPGFSYFAITAQKEAEETPVAKEVTEDIAVPEAALITETVKDEASKVSLKALWITIGVLLVLLIAVFGYRKKHLLIFWREPTDKERQGIIRGEFLNRKKQQSWGSGKDD